ncbi:hypothetical protein ACFL3G_05865 [Planctomycetota bacterium]
MASSADNIVAKGLYGTVEYAVRKDGKKPAQQGLEKLKKKKQHKSKYFAFIALFEQYVNTGSLSEIYLDGLKHNKISGILKFKRSDAYPYRVPCFKMSNSYILTHVYEKREGDGRQIKREVELADTIRSEHKEQLKKS